MRKLKVNSPIFIVGCGRSGTTALYELLAGHPDTAWFSNYTNRWPRKPQLAMLSRLRRLTHSRQWEGPLPRPVEGYRVFDQCRPFDRLRPLTESDVSDVEDTCLQRVVAQHLHYQRARRFINKNTRNSRRIRYLNAIFPDALFIHVVRDPRATVASLLNVSWWPDLPIWSRDAITPREWQSQGGNPVELATDFWIAEVSRILDDKKVLAERYVEIRYEDLTAEPRSTMDGVLEFLRLSWSSRFNKFISSFQLDNRNTKLKERLTDDEILIINREIGKHWSRFGY